MATGSCRINLINSKKPLTLEEPVQSANSVPRCGAKTTLSYDQHSFMQSLVALQEGSHSEPYILPLSGALIMASLGPQSPRVRNSPRRASGPLASRSIASAPGPDELRCPAGVVPAKAPRGGSQTSWNICSVGIWSRKLRLYVSNFI